MGLIDGGVTTAAHGQLSAGVVTEEVLGNKVDWVLGALSRDGGECLHHDRDDGFVEIGAHGELIETIAAGHWLGGYLGGGVI